MASIGLDRAGRGTQSAGMRTTFGNVLCALAVAAGIAASGSAHADIDLFQRDPLVRAAGANDLATAEQMLVRGHNADAIDGKRRTALIIAASRGFEDMVDVLVRHRANVNAVDEFGNSALFYAASRDHVGILEILLEAKAKIDAKNRQGVTPLMAAASAGKPAAVQLLLENGADPKETDFTGRTAGDWAQTNRRRTVLRILERHAGGS